MRQLYFCLLFFILLIAPRLASATHIYGADFFYEHVTRNTYKISLVIYGDCAGQAFPTLDGAAATVIVLESGVQYSSLSLVQDGPGVEVTPVCPAQAHLTSCIDPAYVIPGVKRYIYSAFTTIPYPSSNWVFRFAGALGTSQAGRSNSISNIDIGNMTGSVVTLEALLNNRSSTMGLDSNNSPRFTTIPTPFYCINISQQYNQGAVDSDNDSLVYALAPGLQGTGIVLYKAPYTATAPLATAPGTFSFSSTTGQMSFTPNMIQRSLVVNKVSEYRNGVLVGTASREMTFIVLDNCTATPSYSIVDTSATAQSLGGTPDVAAFYACQATDSIHFSIIPRVPGFDTIIATINGLPSGAKATILRNNTPDPFINIDWKSRNVPAGRYNFFVTYKDNDCPLSSTQTQAYTIVLTQRPVAGIVGPDIFCQGDTSVFTFNGHVGNGPDYRYLWDWHHPGFVEGEAPGPWRVHWLSSGEKTIRLVVEENKCASDEVQKKIFIKPAPYAGISADENVCIGDTLRITHFIDYSKPEGSLTYTWDFDGADTPSANGTGPYIRRWDTVGRKHISLNIDYEGCAGKRSIDIDVRPLPKVRILNAPGSVCIGDKIFLRADGGVAYEWAPRDSLLTSDDGRLFAQILRPSVYRVKVRSDYGCVDSAAISYDDVEPCCNFAYPNAFTPNGDGRNDRFRVVTYGNHLQYELSIYNNWGQRVYYGLDAKEGWDGRFNGKACDAGTYFYHVSAVCFTGHRETYKGSIMLIL